jgi:hypothetical protein
MAKTPPKAATKSGKTPSKTPPAKKGSTLSNLLGGLGGGNHATSPATNNADKTAVKEMLEPEGELASLVDAVGGTPRMFLGCSLCRENLEKVAKRARISTSDMNSCPRCEATFVKEAEVHCYACSANMHNAKCLRCGAKQADDENLKIATIHYRATRGLQGEEARMQANLLLGTEGPTKKAVLANGRTDRVVHTVESSGNVPVAQLQHRPQQQPSYPNNGSNWGAPRRSNGDDPLS